MDRDPGPFGPESYVLCKCDTEGRWVVWRRKGFGVMKSLVVWNRHDPPSRVFGLNRSLFSLL